MKKETFMLILTTIICVVFLIMGVRSFFITKDYEAKIKKFDEQTEMIDRHFKKEREMYVKYAENYDALQTDYNELFKDYKDLKHYKDLDEGVSFYWDIYEVTGYTSLDEGTNNISCTGIDIPLLNTYINIVAVDPSQIALGSVVIIKYNNDLFPALALDIGGDIKNKRIDLYFGHNREEAFNFGRQKLEVGILK